MSTTLPPLIAFALKISTYLWPSPTIWPEKRDYRSRCGTWLRRKIIKCETEGIVRTKRIGSEIINTDALEEEKQLSTSQPERLPICKTMDWLHCDEPHCIQKSRVDKSTLFHDITIITHSAKFIGNLRLIHGSPPLLTGTLASRRQIRQQPVARLGHIRTGRTYTSF